MKNRLLSLLGIMIVSFGINAGATTSSSTVNGVVFWDKNNNGLHDPGEPGLPGVCVTNGKEVVQTKAGGFYSLPAYDEMIISVVKPNGFMAPLNENNIPQFHYIHQPNGSPSDIKEYAGVSPTGELPDAVNFPLLKHRDFDRFNTVIIGDTQVYSDREIEYLRDSIVKDASTESASFVITMGDNVGDRLSLYPRYLKVMKEIGLPVFLVPGNHDMNLDASDPGHAFDTFKREFGPTYYSFNYGKVHFVVLNSVFYPSPVYSTETSKTYHGEIDARQMEWLKNDLQYVPKNHLVVLNMHIPIVSYTDRSSANHQVENREALYKLLEGRKVVSLGGHTHTVENFLPGDQEDGWGQATPISQIIAGAACGSWWSGDLDDSGIPVSYQRLGAPKGYMIFEFSGNRYQNFYKTTGNSFEKQMHLSFKTSTFDYWYNQLLDWLNANSETRPEAPPVTLNDLPDQGRVAQADLSATKLVANVWNGSRESVVKCMFDDGSPVDATRDKEIGDPYALRNQAYVLRYALGFELFAGSQYGPAAPQPLPTWLHTQSSTHTWTCDLPSEMNSGSHKVTVMTLDMNKNYFEETMVFEVIE